MKEKDKPDRALSDVRRAETRRGKRPIDIEERRKRADRLRKMQELLRTATEAEFASGMAEIMRASGLDDDSAEFRQALEIWRGYREL